MTEYLQNTDSPPCGNQYLKSKFLENCGDSFFGLRGLRDIVTFRGKTSITNNLVLGSIVVYLFFKLCFLRPLNLRKTWLDLCQHQAIFVTAKFNETVVWYGMYQFKTIQNILIQNIHFMTTRLSMNMPVVSDYVCSFHHTPLIDSQLLRSGQCVFQGWAGKLKNVVKPASYLS